MFKVHAVLLLLWAFLLCVASCIVAIVGSVAAFFGIVPLSIVILTQWVALGLSVNALCGAEFESQFVKIDA